MNKNQTNEPMKLDEKNIAILNVLLDNARLSYRQIAQKIGVSVATVMHRVQELEKDKIIQKYSAVPDYEKLGYDITVLIEVQVGKGKLAQVENKIAQHPNVVAVYDVTGAFDVVILAKFKNRRTMDVFLKKIQTYDFVLRTNTRLVLQTIKEGQIHVA
jgi:DNA-binding Lrp family transcriptional regulator